MPNPFRKSLATCLTAMAFGLIPMTTVAQEASNAAVVQLYQQGRYAAALDLAQQVLEQTEAALGPDHPQTLASVNNLALLYQSAGRYGEAEPLYRRALEARERVLGPDHPDTRSTLGNLSVLRVRMDRPGDALRSLRQIDLRLGRWIDTETRTAQGAAVRRRVLQMSSYYQDAGFSLA